MNFRNRDTGQVLTFTELGEAHPNVAFSYPLDAATAAEFGYDLVQYAPPPVVPPNQIATRTGAELVGNVWQDAYTISDLPQDQAADAMANAKATAWANIKRYREMRAAGGFQVGDKWFHSDSESRIKYLGLIQLGPNIPTNTQWKTMDGTFVQMTQTLAQQVFTQAVSTDIAVFSNAESHRVQMEASANPNTYDYRTGWPAIFGE